MSFNDRCGEALEILRHGGTLPDVPAVRESVMEWLESGVEGWRFPPRELVYAIKDDPRNAELASQVHDGEWHGEDRS